MATRVTVNRGAIPIPDDLRERFGIEDGAELMAEAGEGGILFRPVDAESVNGFEIEIYTPERKAEFFLNNAMNATEYAWARDEVRRMGIDPDSIPHDPPER